MISNVFFSEQTALLQMSGKVSHDSRAQFMNIAYLNQQQD